MISIEVPPWEALPFDFAREKIELRHYQAVGIKRAYGHLKGSTRRVVLYSPTGSGKGTMAAKIAEQAVERGKKVIFLVHRKTLVNQQVRRFAQYGIPVGILRGEDTCNTGASIVVGSIQTYDSRVVGFGWNIDPDVILIDEAHRCAAGKQYHRLMEDCAKRGKMVIGFTATPFSRGLGKLYPWGRLFEELVVTASIRELIDGGHLVDCDVYAPSEPDLDKVHEVAGDYNQQELGEAVLKAGLIGSIVETWAKRGQDEKTICFAVNILHSKTIVREFNDAGIPAIHLDGYMQEGEIDRGLREFGEGKYKVLSNVMLFAEGFDMPDVRNLILAHSTKSLIKYIQMAGRVLRPAPGKERATIFDHSGTVRRLGLPTDDLPLHLDDGAAKKTKSSKKDAPPLAVCKLCGYVKPRGTKKCPGCGHEAAPPKTPGNAEGELELVSGKGNARASFMKSHKLEIWRGIVRAWSDKPVDKRPKPGWCAVMFKDMVGEWPPWEWQQNPLPGERMEFVDSYLLSRRIRYIKGRYKK